MEKALHAIASYPGGKLPALEGFADPASHSFDDYKRGYYEYDVQVKSMSASETSVAGHREDHGLVCRDHGGEFGLSSAQVEWPSRIRPAGCAE